MIHVPITPNEARLCYFRKKYFFRPPERWSDFVGHSDLHTGRFVGLNGLTNVRKIKIRHSEKFLRAPDLWTETSDFL